MKRMSKAIAWSVVIMFMVTLFAPASVNAATKYGEFPDVESNHWAKQVVTKMNLREVIVGYADGNQLVFKPDQAVTKMEAVIMAIRLMGIDGKKASAETKLPFKVDDWAANAAKIAYENGIIKEEGFKATENASREWVTRLLIRMVEKDTKTELAKAENQVLNFTDNASMSKEFEPYVKLAVQLNLARGNADKTFGPKDAVTRAQLTAFLSRVEADLEIDSLFVLVGEITKKEANEITVLARNHKNQQYKLTYGDRTNFYNQNSKVMASTALKVGDAVYTIAKANKLEYLELRNTGTPPVDKDPVIDRSQLVELKGEILSLNEKDSLVFVKLDEEYREDSSIERYEIGEDVELLNSKDQSIRFIDLNVEDQVRIFETKEGDLVEMVRIDKIETMYREGKIENIAYEGNKNFIWIEENGKSAIYIFDKNTQVTVGNNTDLGMESLKVGDPVKFSVTGSMLDAIAVISGTFDDASEGVVESINDKVIAYRSYGGDLKSNYIDKNVKVQFNDGAGKLADVRVGDYVNIRLKNGFAVEITLTDRNLIENVSGTVKVSYRSDGIIVIVDKNNANKVYEVDSKTDIRVKDYSNSLSSLREGMSIELEVKDKKAIYIRANY